MNNSRNTRLKSDIVPGRRIIPDVIYRDAGIEEEPSYLAERTMDESVVNSTRNTRWNSNIVPGRRIIPDVIYRDSGIRGEPSYLAERTMDESVKSKRIGLGEREKRAADPTRSTMSSMIEDISSPGVQFFENNREKMRPTVATPRRSNLGANRLSTASDKEKTIDMLSIGGEPTIEANGSSYVEPVSVNGSRVSPTREDMLHRHVGPVITEVEESPSRDPSVLRDSGRRHNVARSKSTAIERQIKLIFIEPRFKERPEAMAEVIRLMRKQIDQWERDQDSYGPTEERTKNIRAWKDNRRRFIEQLEDAKERQERARRERDESSRVVETVRRRGDMTGMNVTAIHNSRSYDQRTHFDSEEEEKENGYTSRAPRPLPRSPPRAHQSYHSSLSHQSRRLDASSRDNRSRNDYGSNNVTSSSHQGKPKPRLRAGKSRVTKSMFRPRRDRALLEIRQYQKSTDLLIQKAPFCRLVQEILREEATTSSSDYRIRADALTALQEAAEAFLVEMFEGSQLIATHARRVTLMHSDIQLYRRLCLRK